MKIALIVRTWVSHDRLIFGRKSTTRRSSLFYFYFPNLHQDNWNYINKCALPIHMFSSCPSVIIVRNRDVEKYWLIGFIITFIFHLKFRRLKHWLFLLWNNRTQKHFLNKFIRHIFIEYTEEEEKQTWRRNWIIGHNFGTSEKWETVNMNTLLKTFLNYKYKPNNEKLDC